MLPAELVRLIQESLALVLLVSAPVLGASAAVGLVVGVAGASTQVQEQSLSFVPRLVAVALVLLALGGWMAGEILTYTDSLWRAIPELTSRS